MAKKADVLEQLQSIDRVGPSRAKKLYVAGVRSIIDVSVLDVAVLADAMTCAGSVAKLVSESAEDMLSKDRKTSSTPGLLGTDEVLDVDDMLDIPDIPSLPPIPEPDPVIKVSHGAKLSMLAGPGRRGRGRGPLFGVLVCRTCYVIKAMPNPRIKEKRARYAPMQGGLVATNLVCDCNSRGTYGLERDDRPPGIVESIVGNPRNNIIFSQFRQV